MKKILTFLAVMLILVVSVAAAQPIIFDFSDSATASSTQSLNHMEGAYDASLGFYKLTNTGYDANFTLRLNSPINAADYPVVRYRFRIVEGTPTDKTFSQFFFAVDGGAKMGNDGTYHSRLIQNTADWQEYTVDLSKINASKWSGSIKSFRVDPIQASTKENPEILTIIIDYVAFFSSLEEANAYDAGTPDVQKPQEQKPQEQNPQSTAEPRIIYFNTEESDKFVKIKNNLDGAFDAQSGYYKLKNTNYDPNFSLIFDKDSAFNTADYPIVRYRFKITDGRHASLPQGQFFFETDNGAKMGDDGTYTFFPLENTSGWQDVIVDLSAIKSSKWSGIINTFRVDPVQATDGSLLTVLIHHVGFFPSIEAAKQDPDTATVYTKGNQTIIIPAGSLGENSKDSFAMSDESVDASGKADGYEPVILYKNADGSESVVALSWSNGKRFTYVARKPGQYRAGYSVKEYSDTADHWGLNYIRFVSARALFGGTSPTEFSPDATMTRGMFVTVLGRMHGVETAQYAGDTVYADVNSAEYYAPYINWVTDMKIASGLTDTTFGPEQPITRADMAHILAKYTDAYEYTLNPASDSSVKFNDLEGLDGGVVSAITQMQQAGIINGKGVGIFDPHGISTRAEVATVMARIIKSVLGLPLSFDSAPTSVVLNMSDGDTLQYISVAGDGDIVGNKDGLLIKGYTDQFYITFTPPQNSSIYLEEYPYVKMMYKINSSPSTRAQFYYYTETSVKHTANPYIEFRLKGDIGSWSTMEFDFSTMEKISAYASSQTPWGGKMTRFALYPLRMTSGEPKTTRDMVVKYIAFFSTKEEMEAFDETKLVYNNEFILPEKEELMVSEKLGQDRIHIGAFFPYHNSVDEEDIKELADAGLDISFVFPEKSSLFTKDLILDWHAKHGVMAWIQDSSIRTGSGVWYSHDTKHIVDETYADHPAFYGNIFSDEPGIVHCDTIAKYIDEYKKDFPGKVGFVNLLPMYASNDQLTYGASAQKIDFYDTPAANFEDYVRRYAQTVDTPYICTDIYPLRWNVGKQEKETYKDYVKSIEIVAKVCRETDREFWCYIQSFASRSRAFFRSPDEADIRWQAYSMLSFGIKTMLYYVWTEIGDYFNTPINADGDKNPVWYGAQKLNHEFIAISPVYLQYNNIGAFTHNSENLSYAQMLYPLESFAPIKEVKCDDALLIGCFEKAEGEGYAFTVVNMSEMKLNKTVNVSLKLEGKTVTSYFGGEPQVMTPDANGYYTFELVCGDGVFITIG